MKMGKFFGCVLLLIMVFLYVNVSEAGHYLPNQFDIMVEPFLNPHKSLSQPNPIIWDYRGYLDSSRTPYFNRYFPPLKNPDTGEVWPLFNAAVGCVNIAVGQIMYKYRKFIK